MVFEHRCDGLGVGTATPRVSWKTEIDAAAWRQRAYELEVSTEDGSAYYTGLAVALA
jgi:alpha-L-rhamnosidase